MQVHFKKSGKSAGKLSFIDLAGSERASDVNDNDRQTRIEVPNFVCLSKKKWAARLASKPAAVEPIRHT